MSKRMRSFSADCSEKTSCISNIVVPQTNHGTSASKNKSVQWSDVKTNANETSSQTNSLQYTSNIATGSSHFTLPDDIFYLIPSDKVPYGIMFDKF